MHALKIQNCTILVKQAGNYFLRCAIFSVGRQLLRASLHGFSYYISQVLMMIFMVYNGYMITSLVLGRALGYLVFSLAMPTKQKYRPKPCCC